MNTAIKVFLFATLLLFISSDSITLSKKDVYWHFNNTGDYIYSAARFEHPVALYGAYKQTSEIDYLTQAAKLGHIEAVWELSQILKSSNIDASNASAFWFNQALESGHPMALAAQAWRILKRQDFDALSVFMTSSKVNNLLNQNQLNPTHADAYYELNKINELIKLHRLPTYIGQTSIHKPVTPVNFLDCPNPVLVLASNSEQALKLNRLINSLSITIPAAVDQQNSAQRYCFTKPIVDQRLLAICPADSLQRASCNENALRYVISQYRTNQEYQNNDDSLGETRAWRHVIVMTTSGKANVRDVNIAAESTSVMLLGKPTNAKVMLHEIAHLSGLIDEYRLRAGQQALVCKGDKPYWPGKNVLVAPKGIRIQTLESLFSQKLWPVKTCLGTDYIAYKKHPKVTIMEYFDAPLSSDYHQMIFSD